MKNVTSFTLGMVSAALITGGLTALTKRSRSFHRVAVRMRWAIDEVLHKEHVVHYRHPRDSILLNHGHPVVEGNDAFLNPRFS